MRRAVSIAEVRFTSIRLTHVVQAGARLREGTATAPVLLAQCLSQAADTSSLNAFITTTQESAAREAEESQKRIDNGNALLLPGSHVDRHAAGAFGWNSNRCEGQFLLRWDPHNGRLQGPGGSCVHYDRP